MEIVMWARCEEGSARARRGARATTSRAKGRWDEVFMGGVNDCLKGAEGSLFSVGTGRRRFAPGTVSGCMTNGFGWWILSIHLAEGAFGSEGFWIVSGTLQRGFSDDLAVPERSGGSAESAAVMPERSGVRVCLILPIRNVPVAFHPLRRSRRNVPTTVHPHPQCHWNVPEPPDPTPRAAETFRPRR